VLATASRRAALLRARPLRSRPRQLMPQRRGRARAPDWGAQLLRKRAGGRERHLKNDRHRGWCTCGSAGAEAGAAPGVRHQQILGAAEGLGCNGRGSEGGES
jgi:hypothetical protein